MAGNTSSSKRAAPDAKSAAADRALTSRLATAERRCHARGAQLTAQRREVLELLWRRGGSAKAYDLQDDMRARHGRAAPTTVYRALEFLIEQGLVHRVDAVNAFVACDGDHADHHAMLLVCGVCGDVREWHDAQAYGALHGQLRQQHADFHDAAIEIKGVCGRCASNEAAAP